MHREKIVFNPSKTRDPELWAGVIAEILERKGYDYGLNKENNFCWHEVTQTYGYTYEDFEELYDLRVNKKWSYPRIRKETGRGYRAVQHAIREVEREKELEERRSSPPMLEKWNLEDFLHRVWKKVHG